MSILQIILIIVPGVIAVRFYEALTKESLAMKDWLYHVSKFVILIFWIVNVIEYARGWGEFDWSVFTVQFILKYIPLSLALALLLPPLNLFFDSKILGRKK